MGVKISELTSMGPLAGTEKLAGVDSGTQYTTPADLKTYIQQTYITSQATPSRVTVSAPTAIGQYRSYLRNASARTYTETNGSPTTAPNSSNGYKLYNGNEFASADTNNEPSKYQIYIGTGKNPIFEFYASTGRTGAVFVGTTISGGPSLAGTMFRYDPTTGIVDVYVPVANTFHQCPGVDEFGTNLDADIYFDIKC